MKKKSQFWKEVVEHINTTYFRKRGFVYFFTGRDMKEIKGVVNIFQEWGAMALWDIYLQDDSEWNKKQGWPIWNFSRQIPRLTDDPTWKKIANEYEFKLVGNYPPEILELFKNKS